MKLFKIGLMIGMLMVPVVSFAEIATLTWDMTIESDLAGYKVYRTLTACPVSGPIGGVALKDVGKVITFVDDTIPVDTLDICYAITAYDTSANESLQSNKVGKKFVVVTLPPPTNFKYTVDTFTWDLVLGAKSYLVRVHEEGTPYEPCSAMVYCNNVGTLTTNSLKLVLKLGKKYDTWIHSVDSNGKIGVSVGMTFTTIDNNPPIIPNGLIISSATSNKIIITAMNTNCPKGITTVSLSSTTKNDIELICNR